MLKLQYLTPVAWVARVESHLPELLLDHAHAEKKAAGVGMSLICAYITRIELVEALTEVVREELAHLARVLAVMQERGVALLSQEPSSYGRRLAQLTRKREPEKGLDRCLVAALIEARSCERFQLLADHLQDRKLARFYASLVASEARHHTLFLKLAALFASQDALAARLQELAKAEARIIRQGDPITRLHA